MNIDWKKALSMVAPIIGGAVSGPFAPLVTSGINILSQTLLGKPDGTEAEIAAVFEKGLTPEQAVALKQVDADFKIEMRRLDNEDKKLDIEEGRIDAGDRDSARGLQKTTLQTDDKFVRRFIYYYAAYISGISVLYVFLITFIPIPKENIRFADTVLGFFLGTLLATIINFFYGSSSGSGHKTGILTDMLKKIKNFSGEKNDA